MGSGPLLPLVRSPLGGLWRTRLAASYLCFSPGRLTSLSPFPPTRPPSVHMGLNVFITCLTRCLIASPLNGAVTVETRNKRPPENEMIKQVTLAKQTQPRNLWGWGWEAPPPPTHGQKAWTRPGPSIPVLRTGADTLGRPLLGSGAPGHPLPKAAHLACCALGLSSQRG